MAVTKYVGRRTKRKEDPRLITGSSTYVDDIKLVGLLHVAIVRSIYAPVSYTHLTLPTIYSV